MKISTQDQADGAPLSIHKVSKVVGLYLKVGDGGAASYFLRYRLGDKRREMGIGSRGAISLAKARNEVLDAHGLIRKGVDPISERKRERVENIARTQTKPPVVFKQMAENYLKVHGGRWRHKYARTAWIRPLELYAYPEIAKLGLEQIQIPHVSAIMQRAEDAGAPATAFRVRMRVEQVLSHAIALSGKVLGNLATGKLHPKPPAGDRPHFRAVDLDDAPAVFRELKAIAVERAGSLTGNAFNAWLMMILTASRPSEALGARWSEIILAKKLWAVPGVRMRSGKAHTVPLSDEVLAVLDQQRPACTGDLIFPGRGGSLMSYDTFTLAPSKAGIDAASPHGWRSVFRDFCGDIAEDISRDLAEAALAHSLGKVEASYRRRTAVEKRRPIMESYAGWLSDDGAAKVIAFPTPKQA
jgi:integrase